MLEGLRDIDWSTLDDAYGEAVSIPIALEGLISEQEDDRRGAIDHLYVGICHQGCSVYSATYTAVPFLLALVAEPTVPDRHRILQLLSNMVKARNHIPQFPWESESEHQERVAEADRARHQTRHNIWKGFDTFFTLLRDDDRRLRMTAARILSNLLSLALDDRPPTLPEEDTKSRIVTALSEAFQSSDEVSERANLARIFGTLSPESDELKEAAERVTVSNEAPPVRFAAIRALLEAGDRPLPDEAVDLLLDLFYHPLNAIPWFFMVRSDPDFDVDETSRNHRSHPEYESDFHRREVPATILRLLLNVWPHDSPEFIPLTKSRLEAGIRSERRLRTEGPLTARQWRGVKEIFLNPYGAGYLSVIPTPMLLPLLSDCKNLRVLRVEYSKDLTDAVLATLPELANLEELSLVSTQVTDAGLTLLSRYPRLESVGLADSAITDTGVELLTRLVGLRSISLASTGITDVSGEMFARMPNLQVLNLYRTRFGDAGCIALAKAPSLRVLSLSDTLIGDEGLLALSNLTQLRELDIDDTAVTEEGKEAFLQRRPDCRLT